MYYKEKIIKGLLFFKASPNGEWTEVRTENIVKRMKKAEAKVIEQELLIEEVIKVLTK